MLGRGAGDSQQVAIRIRCGTCSITINVESNLVGMLLTEGVFTCPQCQTQQSINQVALHRLMQIELAQQRITAQLLPQVTKGMGLQQDLSTPGIPTNHSGLVDGLCVHQGLGKRKMHPMDAPVENSAPKRLNLGVTGPEGGPLSTLVPPEPHVPNLIAGLRDPQFEEEEDAEDFVRESAQTYQDYKPAKLTLGPPHSDPVVESLSLSAAEPPDIHYELHIDDVIENNSLSSLQLEAISYACQRHEQFLPDGQRCGFFIGDGAGVGKGRTIAGMILENWTCGRKQHLWISVSADLKHDARRDLDDVGAEDILIHPLNKLPYAHLRSRKCGVEEGVIFLTYSTLISSTEKGTRMTRMSQVLEWCQKDFDGLIVFDECHKAKNLVSDGGQATKTGLSVLKLQELLPKARIVYCSATGATEIRNMAYMVRLGLWGRNHGGGFENFDSFKRIVGGWGVGAMELIAVDLKSRGMYLCRTLSYQGAEFEARTVPLSSDMKTEYRRSCYLWRQLLSQFQYALETLTENDKGSARRVWSQFWSAHQRYFRQMCMCVKVAETVRCAKDAVRQGKCVVIGLQSTGESRMSDIVKEKGSDLDDFASGLKETMLQLLENHYPLPTPTDEIREELAAATILAELSEASKRGRDPNVMTNGCKRTMARSGHLRQSSSQQQGGPSGTGRPTGGDAETDTARGIGNLFNGGPSLTSRRSERQRHVHSISYKDITISDSDEISGEDSSSSSLVEDSDELEEILDSDDGEEEDADAEEEEEDSEGSVILVSDHGEGELSTANPGDSERLEGAGGSHSCRENTVDPVAQEIPYDTEATQRYRNALRLKQQVMEVIESADLPSNPLDTLIDKLGGPDKVAEMTGRKGRMVRSDDSSRIRWEPRNASGADGTSLEAINVTEAGFFMSGRKLVAIISDAASAGISLHADRRHKNQRRRVHITLELPWSADRAVQQFGRTHRSNQASAPQYRLMMTPLGGERRFAAAVARRLQSLGALTQGDRKASHAGPSLGAFDYDSLWGRKALQMLYLVLLEQLPPHVFPSSGVVSKYPSFRTFCAEMRRLMLGVGMLKTTVDARSLRKIVDDGATITVPNCHISQNLQTDIPRFLNRLLGLDPDKQQIIFGYFLDILEKTVETAKKDGRFDNGIMDIKATHVRMKHKPEVIWKEDSGGEALHYTIVTDRGVTFESACQKLEDWRVTNEGSADGSGFYRTKRPGVAGRFFAVLALRISGSNEMYKLVRPATGVASKLLTQSSLDYKFVPFHSQEDANELWSSIYDSFTRIRIREVHVLAGSVLPIWGTTSEAMQQLSESKQRQMRIVRLQTTDENRQVVGILVPEDVIDLVKNGLTTAQLKQAGLPQSLGQSALYPGNMQDVVNGQQGPDDPGFML